MTFDKVKSGMGSKITKPRNPEWLAQNLDDPFHRWNDDDHMPMISAKKAILMRLASRPSGGTQALTLET